MRYAAAIVFIVAGAGVLLHFGGSREINNISLPALSHRLPDGSTVYLNAETAINYNQWLFSISRNVSLQGEAFFKVEKGTSFIVHTEAGQVRVLGTSFNVKAVSDQLQVQCKTGKVAVDIPNLVSHELLPGHQLSASAAGIALNQGDAEIFGNWITMDHYSFTDTAVKEVLEQLSLSTGFTIDLTTSGSDLYTGQFSLQERIEDIMDIVCKPLGLAYEIDHEHKLITVSKP
jgi:ferric-dicitrate binding protein FerR (iron transport regulator)